MFARRQRSCRDFYKIAIRPVLVDRQQLVDRGHKLAIAILVKIKLDRGLFEGRAVACWRAVSQGLGHLFGIRFQLERLTGRHLLRTHQQILTSGRFFFRFCKRAFYLLFTSNPSAVRLTQRCQFDGRDFAIWAPQLNLTIGIADVFGFQRLSLVVRPGSSPSGSNQHKAAENSQKPPNGKHPRLMIHLRCSPCKTFFPNAN